jgi:hypothetical protein
MDKKTTTLVILFILIVGASVALAYDRYIVRQQINYEIDEEAFQAALLEE